MPNNKPQIIVIGGPTGIGKTGVAIRLAHEFGGEIINADSMQIYRLMDIGTAKPTPKEQSTVPHHLIDIINPDSTFDAAQFAGMAHGVVSQLHKEDILPFVVGGTGLYIKALVHGLFDENASDSEIRRALRMTAETQGTDSIHQTLEQVDPDTAKKLHPNDAFRIIRALEVYQVTGKPISAIHKAHRFSDRRYRALKFGLYMDRDVLYHRINKRVDAMIAEGLMDEVKKLLGSGFTPKLKSMQSLGYRHMVDCLDKKTSLKEAVEIMKRDTRRYAKRQMTWFRADPDMIWFQPEQIDLMAKRIEEFVAG